MLESLIANENTVSLLSNKSFSKRKVRTEVINWACFNTEQKLKLYFFVLRDLEVPDVEKRWGTV